MASLEMTEEEGKLLLDVLDRYHSHLEVEIRRTDHRAFKDALKEREKSLVVVVERLRKLVK
jgi:hypothetical protein